MAQRGRSSSAATPATLSATRSTRRALRPRRGREPRAPTASRRRCATSTAPSSSELLERAEADCRSRRVPALRLGAAALQLPRRQRGRVLMTEFDALSKREGFDPARAGRWRPGCASRPVRPQRDPRDPPRWRARGSTTSAGSAPSAACRTSTTCSSSARASRATRSRATASAARPTSRSATRFASEPIDLEIPITIAGMSFGALSAPAKEALGRGASAVGTSTTTGDGGMLPEEREHSKTLVYQILPSRYGMNPDDLRRADAVEVVVGQGAKPGGGGMLLGQKISDRVAEMRDLPEGDRPAQRLPPPRLDGPRRPRDQDRRAARDHRLAQADLRQDRRHADLLRRRPGGQGGRRRDRARRHGGRHGGEPGGLHRARRDPDPCGDPGGRRARCRSSACTARSS